MTDRPPEENEWASCAAAVLSTIDHPDKRAVLRGAFEDEISVMLMEGFSMPMAELLAFDCLCRFITERRDLLYGPAHDLGQ